MANIVHVIQELSRGGAARATIYLAKYSARFGGHEHTILSLLPPDKDAVRIAEASSIRVVAGADPRERDTIIREADITQFSWWNNVQMQQLFKESLPPMRSVGWFHVGGTASPQVITPKLVDYFDRAVACSPYTYQCAAIQSMSLAERSKRTAMVYGATDFARLQKIVPKPHDGFVVGYVGTLDFLKMHRNYVSMSAAADIPGAKFLFCGSGEAVPAILSEARAIGKQDSFEYGGYVEDIRDLLSIIDVYGYPLCKETYAASEMNLQEVMFAGIPSVVFPYGGVQDLVIHDETGLIVESEAEYAEALEYLYRHPDERKRLGENARRYAAELFGAENAGRAVNAVYGDLLREPKRSHIWGGTAEERSSGRVRIGPEEIFFGKDERVGHKAFIESLGFQAKVFLASIFAADEYSKIRADMDIAKSSAVLRQSGIGPYKNAYPDDPYLQYWDGLAHMGAGLFGQAVLSFVEASKGLGEWRVFHFMSAAAAALGETQLAAQAGQIASEAAPKNSGLHSPRIRELLETFGS